MERVRTVAVGQVHPALLDEEAPLEAPRLRVDLTIEEDALPRALALGSTGTGVFIPMEKRVAIGRSVDVVVRDLAGRTVARVLGEVSWTRAPGAHATFPAGIGIKVVSLTFESARWIARLCSDLHAESREAPEGERTMTLGIECPRCRLTMELHEHLTLMRCFGCGTMLAADD